MKWIGKAVIVVHYKKYRLDIKRWEIKVTIARIPFYKYEIFTRKPMIKLFTPLPNAKYFEFKPFERISLTKEEFERDYQNNKWLVPINRELPCAE